MTVRERFQAAGFAWGEGTTFDAMIDALDAQIAADRTEIVRLSRLIDVLEFEAANHVATARQEGVNEGLEMAANDINSQSINGETTEVVLDRVKSTRRIRALKTAPTAGGENE